MSEFASFDDFFPFYVSQHSKPLTRRFHFVGSHLGAGAALIGLARRSPRWIAAAPALAYGLAWFSHFVIEKNKPASFGHPLWSIRGDAVMLARMWQGRDHELTDIAADVLADRQPGIEVVNQLPHAVDAA